MFVTMYLTMYLNSLKLKSQRFEDRISITTVSTLVLRTQNQVQITEKKSVHAGIIKLTSIEYFFELRALGE